MVIPQKKETGLATIGMVPYPAIRPNKEKMMKRWKWIIYFLLLALTFSGCGTSSDEVSRTANSNTQITLPVLPLTATLLPTILPIPATPTKPVNSPVSSFVGVPLLTPTPVTTSITIELSITPMSDTTALTPPYEYLKLEELSIDEELKYVAWETDGFGLVYAVLRPEVRSVEPKDWAWWRYDPETGDRESIPPPISRVTSETRQQLNLCPIEQEPLVEQLDCLGHSKLLESPISDWIVFSPLNSGDGDTWIGKFDGTNLHKLETLIDTGTYAQWSPDGRWLLISVHFPGMPGQMTHYLVRADGSFEAEFSALTDHDLFLLNGLFPQFNPDGTKLAYVGSTVYESFDENDYHLYILDLDSLESHLVSDRIGLFQWSADGQGLYVLDGGLYPVDPYEDFSGERKVELYYVDVTSQPGEERIIAADIPYYPHNSTGTWLWSYSPFVQALAYVGHERVEEFGVLLLSPTQTVE